MEDYNSEENHDDPASVTGFVRRIDTTIVGEATRTVICTDAMSWLNSVPDNCLRGSVFTSLPDISELPLMFKPHRLDQAELYKEWFTETAASIMRKLCAGQYAIFLQSDVRVYDLQGNILQWLDKSFLCSTAAARSDCRLMWHKLVLCSGDLDRKSMGRPSYSHLLCYGKETSFTGENFATPDVFDRGDMVWPKGIGLDCCLMGVAFLKEVAKTSCVIDPFCGYGTVLAMANAVALDSIGVEISFKRCRKAGKLRLNDKLDAIPPARRRLMGLISVPPYTRDSLVNSHDKIAQGFSDGIQEPLVDAVDELSVRSDCEAPVLSLPLSTSLVEAVDSVCSIYENAECQGGVYHMTSMCDEAAHSKVSLDMNAPIISTISVAGVM